MEAEEVRAAGALVWRAARRFAQVLLVHRPKYDDWSFPKGKLQPGEHVLLAAVREVAEETGLAIRLGRRLPPVRYLTRGARKRVDYWVATALEAGGEFVPNRGFVPNREVDSVAWVDADESAASRLSYPRDAQALAAFLAGPQRTAPLILLRHASAGSKSDWRSDDALRPLDAAGSRDAAVLASLLSCFGVSRVVSAPAERCVATVRPYAAAVRGAVAVEPALDIGSSARAPAQASLAGHGGGSDAEKVAAALAAADEPVIVCAHRENMPILLAAACAELGAGPPAEPNLDKGEFLVLHRADGRLAAIERYHPRQDS
ncbi:MAG: NUDIX hydrolase [Actinobacteria bacterium]|nr:NUDIX hydrolase [Actinomycetota bacterium]